MEPQALVELDPPGDLHFPQEINKRIEILSHVANLLGSNDVSFSSLTSEIDALSDEQFRLQSSNNRLVFIEGELAAALADTSHDLQMILKWKESLESELAPSETPASLERKREALIRRAKELHKNLEKSKAESTDNLITITQLLKLKAMNVKKDEDIKIKKAKLKAFQGLPPNLELARHELLQAQQEQVKLIQLRERLLGSMANNIS